MRRRRRVCSRGFAVRSLSAVSADPQWQGDDQDSEMRWASAGGMRWIASVEPEAAARTSKENDRERWRSLRKTLVFPLRGRKSQNGGGRGLRWLSRRWRELMRRLERDGTGSGFDGRGSIVKGRGRGRRIRLQAGESEEARSRGCSRVRGRVDSKGGGGRREGSAEQEEGVCVLRRWGGGRRGEAFRLGELGFGRELRRRRLYAEAILARV
jgi:hypothetical protein